MLKFLNGRKDVEALRFLSFAGAKFPEAEGALEYRYTKQGVVIMANALLLGKGRNVITLPMPELADQVLMLVGVAPEILERGATMPLTMFDSNTRIAPSLTLTSKEENTYTGSLATYYVLSGRE